MLLAYEDARFYEHDGVDLRALARARRCSSRARGHIVSGGSTLTMQVARLIEPREERTLGAKLRQIARAWQIERRVSKHGVLDRYLALAPFGGNLEGVRAASLAYFGKEPRRLTIGEAALLVALPQSPEARRPDRFADAARRARDRVLDRAAERGVISAGRGRGAPSASRPASGAPFPMLAAACRRGGGRRRSRNARVIRLADRRAAAGEARGARQARARARLGPKLSAAIVVIDNASGEIRARVGAADYLSTPRATARSTCRARRARRARR